MWYVLNSVHATIEGPFESRADAAAAAEVPGGYVICLLNTPQDQAAGGASAPGAPGAALPCAAPPLLCEVCGRRWYGRELLKGCCRDCGGTVDCTHEALDQLAGLMLEDVT